MEELSRHRVFNGTVTNYQHESQTTQTPMSFSAFVPDHEQGTTLPSLLFLSGLTCTDQNFMNKAGAFKTAAALGVAIICPDTSPRGLDLPEEHDSWDFGSGAGFYLDAKQKPWDQNYKMYSYITNEFLTLIKGHLPVDPDKLGICGHSMGGMGALIIGLRNPKLFKSISAFSPICSPIKCPWGRKAFTKYLGTEETSWLAYDPSHLLSITEYQGNILVDQGTADQFLQEQLKPELLQQSAKKYGRSLTLRMQKDYDHSYYFISTFIGDHLTFHHEILTSN